MKTHGTFALAALAALSLAVTAHAADKKSDAKDQAKKIENQKPTKTDDSRKPKETMSDKARQGFDTPAKDKGVVKADAPKKNDAVARSKEGNKQIQQEQKDTAKKFPAKGKEPPSPGK